MFAQKSVLARLLANENITVQQGNYETAFFDVKSRTLGLPLWKDMSKDVLDMLVGHEIAHALFTPENFNEYVSEGIPHSHLNIVEDVRIEKHILRKYPGLVGNFKRGYTELMMGEKDLFGIKEKNLYELGFMDRLNIHAKARDLVDVPFADDELPFVAQAKACETYDDVVQCCRDIQQWLGEKSKDSDNKIENEVLTASPMSGDSEMNPDDSSTESNEDSMTDEESTEESETGNEENKSSEDTDESNEEATTGENGEEEEAEEEPKSSMPDSPESGLMDQEVLTETNFNENVSKLKSPDVVYAKGLTRQEAKACTISYEEIRDGRQRWLETQKGYGYNPEFPEDKYVTFIKETKRVVNLMVKEFEMRKAAWRSLRARESTKGTIDVNKLHKYQYDDMLFKQVSNIADAKNHGMMMLIDYSGSMYHTLPGVIRQTLTLMMFCKRVGIPFEVYSFTSVGSHDDWKPMLAKKKAAKPSVTHIESTELALLKLFDSTMTKRDYDEAFRRMFWQTVNRSSSISEFEQLGNTPLNTALMAMQYIIEDFREKHRVQKMNFVALTDGDSNGILPIGGDDLSYDQGYGYRYRNLSVEVNGKMVDLGRGNRRDHTSSLVKAIGDMGVSTLNYFIADRNYELNGELCRSLGYVYKTDSKFRAKKKEIRDTGVALFDNNCGYDRRFVMPADKMSEQIEDLDVDSDMTVAKIAKAFNKSNGSKKKSKVITQKFAELVA
jgi:hypothetical protein